MSYHREAHFYNLMPDDTSVFEVDLRDGSAYLQKLELKDIRLDVNAAQTALVFNGFKIRILNGSGYWGSNGQDVVVTPTRSGDVLTRNYTHFLQLIECQTLKTTEKMQPLKFQFLTMDDVVIRRDFIHMRVALTWTENHVRSFGESFIAH